jgi:hypothetical protein
VAWLIHGLKAAFKFIIPYLAPEIAKEAAQRLKEYFEKLKVEREKRALDKAREKAIGEAVEKILYAGTNKDLTPDQRMKEQEDAFKKMVDVLRSHS